MASAASRHKLVVADPLSPPLLQGPNDFNPFFLVNSKKGRQKGDGNKSVINSRKISYDMLWRTMTIYDGSC